MTADCPKFPKRVSKKHLALKRGELWAILTWADTGAEVAAKFLGFGIAWTGCRNWDGS
jgi:hypothetical protein